MAVFFCPKLPWIDFLLQHLKVCLCCLLNPLSREAHWPFFKNDVTFTVKSFNLLSPFLLSYSIRLEMLYKRHILLLLRFILMAVFLNFRLTLPLDHFLFCLCWLAPRRVVVSSTESHPFSIRALFDMQSYIRSFVVPSCLLFMPA